MQSPADTTVPGSLMVELSDLLDGFPIERSRQQSEVLGSRLADLEHRARSQRAAKETLPAIQGARLVLDPAKELLPSREGA